jgi:spermidine synthase
MTAMTRRAQAGTGNRVDTGQGCAELLQDADRRAAWMLLIDGVPQSHVDLDDPGYLEFEYVRRLGHVLDTAAPAEQPLHVLHLGAGALTLARYVVATRPASPQVVVELDTALLEFLRLRLPLPRPRAGGRIRVRTGDARAVLEQMPAACFDVVIADVFAGGRTPAHLTSVEFVTATRRALRESGIFAANVADGMALAHARTQVATARAVFPQACLIADAAVLRGRRFGNLVLAASGRELPVDTLTRLAASDPMPGRVLHGRELTGFAAGAKPVTDANARPSPAAPPGAFASLAPARFDRGEHAAADEGEIVVGGHVGRHRVNQVAERPQPHSRAHGGHRRRRHVDVVGQLHDADRAEHPHVRHAGHAPGWRQPGFQARGQPGHGSLPPVGVPTRVEQHRQRR